MKHSVIGMDIAKRVFQLHSVDPTTGEIERIKLRRDEVLPFFAQRSASLVAIEACGSAHWWARELRRLGHEVKLLAPKSVRPFVRSNKTDAADARAIWTAVQQPEARLVAVKSEQQQAILALHRLRAQLMKFRIMQTNALRGLLYEFGEVLPEGYSALAKALPAALASVAERLLSYELDRLFRARAQPPQTRGRIESGADAVADAREQVRTLLRERRRRLVIRRRFDVGHKAHFA